MKGLSPLNGLRLAQVVASLNCAIGSLVWALSPSIAQAAPGETSLVSVSRPSTTAAGVSSSPAISANGRYIVFSSDAPNLVTDDRNRLPDFFVFDRVNATKTRVELPSPCGGFSENSFESISDAAINANGRVIAFAVKEYCYADDPPHIALYVHDMDVGSNRVVWSIFDDVYFYSITDPSFSADGRYLSFLYQFADGPYHVVIVDLSTNEYVTTGLGSGANEADGDSKTPQISADDTFVVFASDATNLIENDSNSASDVFIFNRTTGFLERVSQTSTGGQINGNSYSPVVSSDGRFVTFVSAGSNVVPGDTNAKQDIFVRDRLNRITTRVSVSTSGAQANGASGAPSISADGRYVTFRSNASNLIGSDTNGREDIFIRDRLTPVTAIVSATASGTQANNDSYDPSISSDGRYVAFGSKASNLVGNDTNVFGDVFVKDRVAITLKSASTSTGPAAIMAFAPTVSLNGNIVAFTTAVPNLVPGDSNNASDVFVRDRAAKTTTRVSVSTAGAQGNQASGSAFVSNDGRYVIFDSYATNLIGGDTNGAYDVFIRDRVAKTTDRVSVTSSELQANSNSRVMGISSDARYILFESGASNLVPGDTNGVEDLFVRDTAAGTTSRVSVSPSGQQLPNPSYGSISANGRYVIFSSDRVAYLRDRTAGVTTQVDHYGLISGDGRYVVFNSRDELTTRMLLSVQDLQTKVIRTLNVVTQGHMGVGAPQLQDFSADGRFVSYLLYDDDSVWTTVSEVYVHDINADTSVRIDRSSAGVVANDFAFESALSDNGQYVAFSSLATNLTPEPVSGQSRYSGAIYIHEPAFSSSVGFGLSPTILSFGNVSVGIASATKTTVITNDGSTALPINSIVLSGTNAAEFTRWHDCPTQLPVGARCTVSVKFKPTSKGSKTATLKVTPGGGAASKTVSLAGTGI